MEYYDSISEGYDSLYKEEQMKKLILIKNNLSYNEKSKILDVGCGTFFLDEVFPADIYGIEPSLEMLKQNQRFRELFGKKLFHGGVEELQKFFSESFFDIVLCVTSAHHFKDVGKAFDSIRLVSKKDAQIVFSLLKTDSVNKLIDEVEKHFNIQKKVDEGKDIIVFCTMNHPKDL